MVTFKSPAFVRTCQAWSVSNWRRRLRIAPPDAEWERMAADIGVARDDRRLALAGQEGLVRELEAILLQHDPIGINFDENTDECRAEAETITLRRTQANSVDDVRRIAHEEFVRWFDAETCGTRVQVSGGSSGHLAVVDAGHA
jgi:hypothetical protein